MQKRNKTLSPPRSTIFWKPERSKAVAMSCPSRTHEEFIRPMNLSISSSDLCEDHKARRVESPSKRGQRLQRAER